MPNPYRYDRLSISIFCKIPLSILIYISISIYIFIDRDINTFKNILNNIEIFKNGFDIVIFKFSLSVSISIFSKFSYHYFYLYRNFQKIKTNISLIEMCKKYLSISYQFVKKCRYIDNRYRYFMRKSWKNAQIWWFFTRNVLNDIQIDMNIFYYRYWNCHFQECPYQCPYIDNYIFKKVHYRYQSFQKWPYRYQS